MENLKIRKAMALILIITILMINSLNLLNGIVVAYDENQEVQEDDRFNQLIENIDTEVKQEVVKFTKVNENSVLLQQNVMVKSNNSELPKEKEEIEVVVPELDTIKPSNIAVIHNGNYLESKYDADTNKLSIVNETNVNIEDKATYGNGEDLYKIIYTYEGQVEVKERSQNFGVNVKTKFHKKEDVVEKNISEDITIKETQEFLTGNLSGTQELPKQYFTIETAKKAYIEENNVLEIVNTQDTKDISIELGETKFVDTKNKEIEASTFLESTSINKEQFRKIFGEEAKLEVNEIEGVEVKEEENQFVINYPENTVKANLKITGTPVQVGELEIKTKKYFTNSKIENKQLDNFTKIQNVEKVNYSEKTNQTIFETNIGKEEVKANLEINKTEFLATEINNNVEMIATLESKEISDALYKNPVVKITFPNQIKNVNVNSINLLYDDQLKIVKAQQSVNANGCIEILLTLSGAQTDYKNDTDKDAQIVVSANIELSKNIPSFESQIQLDVTNEGYDVKSINKQVKGIAKYGLFAYSETKIDENNGVAAQSAENNNVIMTYDSQKVELQCEQDSKNVERNISVVNNNEYDIDNVIITGSITKNGIQMSYLNNIKADKDVKILYSTEAEGENWIENVQDFNTVQRYKIVLEKMLSKEVLNITYSVNIPANLADGIDGYVKEDISYQINGQDLQDKNEVLFSVPAKQQEAVVDNGADTNDTANSTTDNIITTTEDNVNSDKIDVTITAKSGSQELKDGDEVYNGQAISYIAKITNKSNETLKNVYLAATQQNGTLYNMKVYKVKNPHDEVVDSYQYSEDEKCKQYVSNKIDIEPNATVELQYQVGVKDKKENSSSNTQGTVIIGADDGIKNQYKTINNVIKEAKIKVYAVPYRSEDATYTGADTYPIVLYVQNLTNTELTNVKVKAYMNGMTYIEGSLMDEETSQVTQVLDDEITLNVPKLEASGIVQIQQDFQLQDMDIHQEKAKSSIYFTSEYNNNIYTANTIEVNLIQKNLGLNVDFKGSQTKETLTTGDKVDFTTTIKSDSAIEGEISIGVTIPNGCVIDSAYVTIDGKREEISDIKNNKVNKNLTIGKNSEVELVVKTTVDTSKATETDISAILYIDAPTNTIQKEVSYKLENVKNPDDNNEDLGPNTISGMAWIDTNENGERDENTGIPGMKVKLITSEGKQIYETITDENGKYKFENVKNGKYIVAFVYDSNEYSLTTYQKEDVEDYKNSDTIAAKSNGENLAITNYIEIKDDSYTNIDSGFIKNKNFDFKLDKVVTNITIADNKGESTKTFNNSKLAKAEINAKTLENTVCYINYKIIVTNEGEIAGKVNEIVDYLPSEMSFDKTQNAGWYQSNDGNIHTMSLKDVLINPGETKEINLILAKKMNNNNLGTIENKAEILSSTNSQNLKDTDNDETSSANVILSIKTGRVIIITTIIIITLIGFGIGVLKIRKEVKE